VKKRQFSAPDRPRKSSEHLKLQILVFVMLPVMLMIAGAWLALLFDGKAENELHASNIIPFALVIIFTGGMAAYTLGKLTSQKRASDNFGAVFRACPIPMVLVEKNDITVINPEFSRIFGYTLNDIPTLDAWYPKAYPDSDYRSDVIEAWRTRLQGSNPDGTNFEPLKVSIRCKSGQTKSVLATATPLASVGSETYLITLYDITEQTLTLNALSESRTVLQSIIETIPMRVFWKDRNSRFLGCNTSFARDSGETGAQDVIGKTDADMSWRDEAAFYQADDRLVMQTNAPKLGYEELQTGPDGRKKWLRTYKLPLRNAAGETIGILGVYEDITERKEIENELWLTKTMIDSSKTAFFRLSPTGMVQYVNDYACQSLGYAREELLGMYPWEFDPDFKAEYWPGVWERLQQHEIVNIETRHRRKDGAIFDVEVTGHYLSFDGEEFSFTFAQDISKRKAAEKALRTKESYQRALIDNFPFIVWLKDTESRFLAVNQAFAKTYGFNSAEELVGKSDFDLSSPELAEMYRSDDIKIMATRQKESFEEEIENQEGRGWIETFKAPVMDDHGELLGTVGFARDITERKAAEADLRISATAFESREGMIITDADTVILKINEAFTRITGYTAEESIGQRMRLLRSGIHDHAFYTEMWSIINSTDSWQGEVWNRRKNGEIYPEWLTITAIKDRNGKVTHYVGTMIDITVRKAVEEQVQHLAHHDALTDLPNRLLLTDRLRQAAAQAKRDNIMLALMYLDLDNFKPVNDTLGHNVGDLLLQQVASRLLGCVKRESDTVARLGGDEFVVLLPHIEKGSDAATIAECILDALMQPFHINGSTINISSSIGIAIYPESAQEVHELMKNADTAMYEAKKAGRSCIRFFEPDASVGIPETDS